MLIKNLTDKMQAINVETLGYDRKGYTIYIQPHGVSDVSDVLIIDKENIGKVIEIVGIEKSHEPEKTPEVKEPQILEEKSVEEESPKSPEYSNPDEFICDICGAEFASARSLSAHKHKAHPDDK